MPELSIYIQKAFYWFHSKFQRSNAQRLVLPFTNTNARFYTDLLIYQNKAMVYEVLKKKATLKVHRI